MIRTRRHILVLATPAFVYLAVMAVVAALYVRPPAIGWVGFGVVTAVSIALTVAAVVLFPRTRMNTRDAAAPPTADRVLVLADAGVPDSAFDTIPPAAEVLVVAPVLSSPLHYVCDDEARERAVAQARLDAAVAALRARHVHARGVLGADDPLQALDDAAPGFAPAEIVLATPPTPHWLEPQVAAHARELAPTVEWVS